MSEMLIWGLALLAIAGLLLASEVFIPSAGIISALAATAAIAGIVCLFKQSPAWGFTGIGIVILSGPTIFFGVVNVWRNTRSGRRVIGAPTDEEIAQRAQETEAERQRLAALVGQEGVALTDLRPVGLAQIGSQRLEVFAETRLIDKGTRVRITIAESSQIKVRAIGA
jgi:membrane-bound serine protease (ClpP class)